MKFRTFLFIAIPLIIVGLVFAFWPQVKASAAKLGINPGGDGGTSTGGGTTPYMPAGTGSGGSSLDLNKVLSNGVRGKEVEQLQLILNAAEKSNPLVVDGIFGAKTLAKLKRLNGNVGSITLNQALSKITSYTR